MEAVPGSMEAAIEWIFEKSLRKHFKNPAKYSSVGGKHTWETKKHPELTVDDCTLPLPLQGHCKAPGGNELPVQHMKCHKFRRGKEVENGVLWNSQYAEPAVVLHMLKHPFSAEEMRIVSSIVHKVGESHRCSYEK